MGTANDGTDTAPVAVPWEPWPHGWRLGRPDDCVAFDASGLRALVDGIAHEVSWHDVLGLTISFGRHSRARDIWEFVSPRPTPGLAFSSTVAIRVQLTRRDLDLEVPMVGPCPWRVAFIVEDLIRALSNGRLHLLGRPGLVDGVVNELLAKIPWAARLLINTDLFGVDRFLGGHGAYERDIEDAIRRLSP